MNNSFVENKINDRIKLINEALDLYLPKPGYNSEIIHEAMRYSVNAGGKRLRPVLLLAAAEAVGGDYKKAIPAACAIEMIHTYSLIHDDLPAMDDDDYRRGKPTSHMVYGESIAILAGDALLTHAFELLGEADRSVQLSGGTIAKVVREIAYAAGSRGMIGGQVVDILSENREIDKKTLEYIHSHKTGALFKASVRTGAIIGGASETELRELTQYAESFGVAFQITDDILDVAGDSKKLGKTVGSDERKKKATYPSLFGLEQSKTLAVEAVEAALNSLKTFGERADILKYFARYLINREN